MLVTGETGEGERVSGEGNEIGIRKGERSKVDIKQNGDTAR